MKKVSFWLKPLLAAIVLHIALITISVITELIYSSLINPGKDAPFYRDHAEKTGPWISGICGSILVFLIVRLYIKKSKTRFLAFAISFPILYFVTDTIILSFFPVKWNEIVPVILLSNGIKFIAALLSYYIYRRPEK